VSTRFSDPVSFIDYSSWQEEPFFPLVDTPDDQVCPKKPPRDIFEHLNPIALPIARLTGFGREEKTKAPQSRI
jgi:hypothetical protein